MKDIYHIRQDVHLAAWVMPRGGTLGVPWGVGVKKIFPKIRPHLVCDLLTRIAHAPFLWSSAPGALGGVTNLIF